ncbi:MAG: hypothetical protein ACKV1O_15500 [Saprospiraceae bacterium]
MKKLFLLLFAYFTFAQLSCPEIDETPWDWFPRLSYDFDIQGARLYLANTRSIRSFELTDPVAPALTGAAFTENGVFQVEATPGFSAVIGNFTSLVFPLNANGVPETPFETQLFDGCLPVVSNAGYFFSLENITAGCRNPSFAQGSMVRIIPISNPLPEAALIKTVSLADPRDVAIEGDLLFIADGLSGLKVFSIADLDHIQLLSHHSDLIATRVQVGENRLTVLSDTRLLVFDYSNPAALQLLAEMPF